jgi:hypothetical protein
MSHAEDRQAETENMHAASREINHLLEVKAVMLEALEYADSRPCNCQSLTDDAWHSANCYKPKIQAAIRLAKGEQP